MMTSRRFRDELLRQRFTLDGIPSDGPALLEERPGALATLYLCAKRNRR